MQVPIFIIAHIRTAAQCRRISGMPVHAVKRTAGTPAASPDKKENLPPLKMQILRHD